MNSRTGDKISWNSRRFRVVALLPAPGGGCDIVRSMVDANDALAVMGNPENNAIAFHTPVPGKQNAWFRPHSEKNLKQHAETLKQLSSTQPRDAINWFRTLPVALNVDGNACAKVTVIFRKLLYVDDTLADWPIS